MKSTPARIDGRDFVDWLTLPVLQAIAAVRWLEGRVHNRPKIEELRPEKAALTDADCVSQEILLVALRERFPALSLEVEEDTPTVADFATQGGGDTVVIDPIDGTLRYLRGDGPYAILVGLEREGRVEAALVGLPQRRMVIRAVRGGGAQVSHCSGRFEPATLGRGRGRVYVSYGLPEAVLADLQVLGLEPSLAAGGAIGVAPLLDDVECGLRIAATPEGVSRRAWVSALPTLEAGGCVEALDGPLPERYEPGVRGVLAAASANDLARIRNGVGLPPGRR